MRRRGSIGLARIEEFQRGRGALDRRFADFVGMGEGGGLTGNAAQPEPRSGVIIGGLQPAVVEAERLARRILEEKLAVVMRRQVLRREIARRIGIEGPVKEPPRIGSGHAACWSAGPPSRTKRRSQ
jgi:hypothetical protein